MQDKLFSSICGAFIVMASVNASALTYTHHGAEYCYKGLKIGALSGEVACAAGYIQHGAARRWF